ncbi:hypothetical protein VTL71DRAFT_10931 [Oculimacula yallundae]|uniref:F-box domain-containing protein n=1 Tax=Oculimacula yallundae TaxID=86028 RepID=A0ABR4CUP4_9HELO
MSSSSAQDHVLSLPELISAIILQLPIQNILINVSLVNHTWKAAVDSPPVQQALFLLPRISDQGIKPEFNPLLIEKFPSWFKTTQPKTKSRGKRGWEFNDLEWGSSVSKIAAYKRKDASWRRMLPVQPPATTFEVRRAEHWQAGSSYEVGEVTIPGGVRMGMLYDWAQKTVRTPISDFQVKWYMAHPDEDVEPGFGMMRDEVETEEVIEERKRGRGMPKVVMRTSYTMQCAVDMELDVGEEFVSDGFEELELVWGKKPISVNGLNTDDS